MSDFLLILLILLNFKILSSNRIGASIHDVAIQAFLLGALGLFTEWNNLTWHTTFATGISILLKSIVMPLLLFRALKTAEVKRSMEPVVGPIVSMLFGVVALFASLWVAKKIPIKDSTLMACAIFTALTGIFMVVSREKALTQVLGYLIMENGIAAFGLVTAIREPVLIEMGVLLDIFVAVFVMGIMVCHINREFDHMDTDQLSQLKDF